jgi:hypothetical protein
MLVHHYNMLSIKKLLLKIIDLTISASTERYILPLVSPSPVGQELA